MKASGEPDDVELDASRFSKDDKTRIVAEVVAAQAEKRRQEYRLSEQPFKGMLSDIGVYWSDTVPWYEWIEEPRVVESCAKECGLAIPALAEIIALHIKPKNWQVFYWMGLAFKGLEHKERLTDLVSKHETNLAEMRNKRQSDARAAANALHSKPGGSREKQSAIQALWRSGKYSSRDVCAEQECAGLEMSFSAARKALRNTPKDT
jgi:hypothetical protein